nr:hypothetical protein [Tanacetum cinerariifolium]GEX60722.1 hypothetical protein [Tanacetum cinerariifolium]
WFTTAAVVVVEVTRRLSRGYNGGVVGGEMRVTRWSRWQRCGGGARLSHEDGEVVRLAVVMEMKVVAMMRGGGVVVDVGGVEMGQ